MGKKNNPEESKKKNISGPKVRKYAKAFVETGYKNFKEGVNVVKEKIEKIEPCMKPLLEKLSNTDDNTKSKSTKKIEQKDLLEIGEIEEKRLSYELARPEKLLAAAMQYQAEGDIGMAVQYCDMFRNAILSVEPPSHYKRKKGEDIQNYRYRIRYRKLREAVEVKGNDVNEEEWTKEVIEKLR